MAKNRYLCDCDMIHPDAVALALNKIPGFIPTRTLCKFFKLIGDRTRCRICFALDQHEMCVCDLANALSMSKSSVSHHLKLLREHQIIRARTAGREVYYTLSDQHVHQIFQIGLEHTKHQLQEQEK